MCNQRFTAVIELLYVGPGWYRNAWPSSAGQTTSVCNQPPRPTQPPTLSWTGSDYRPRCGDALRGWEWRQDGSFHLWIKRICVADKTVWSVVNTCHYLSALEMSFLIANGLLPGPFLFSHSVFVVIVSLFFRFCAVRYRLSWPSRQLLSAR